MKDDKGRQTTYEGTGTGTQGWKWPKTQTTWLSKMHHRRPFTWQTVWLVTLSKMSAVTRFHRRKQLTSSARRSVINRVYLVSLISKKTKQKRDCDSFRKPPHHDAQWSCSVTFVKQTNQPCHPHYAATDQVWGGQRVRWVWTSLLALSLSLPFVPQLFLSPLMWTSERDAVNVV